MYHLIRFHSQAKFQNNPSGRPSLRSSLHLSELINSHQCSSLSLLAKRAFCGVLNSMTVDNPVRESNIQSHKSQRYPFGDVRKLENKSLCHSGTDKKYRKQRK